MPRSDEPIRFEARLHRPLRPKGATWAFLVLPADASAKLPTRATTAVEGRIEGHPFTATLEPDGKGSHWLKVGKALQAGAGAGAGDTVAVEMRAAREQPEPRVPPGLRKALAASPAAMAVWKDITTVARRDWIQWIESAKKQETRERRVASACDMLESGKRRVCCFDRSGIYGGNFSAPEAAD